MIRYVKILKFKAKY